MNCNLDIERYNSNSEPLKSHISWVSINKAWTLSEFIRLLSRIFLFISFSPSLHKAILPPTLTKKDWICYECDPVGELLNYFQPKLKILGVEMLVVTSACTVSKLQQNRRRSKLTVSVAWSAKKEAEPSCSSFAVNFPFNPCERDIHACWFYYQGLGVLYCLLLQPQIEDFSLPSTQVIKKGKRVKKKLVYRG
jgi:hypothetical protein